MLGQSENSMNLIEHEVIEVTSGNKKTEHEDIEVTSENKKTEHKDIEVTSENKKTENEDIEVTLENIKTKIKNIFDELSTKNEELYDLKDEFEKNEKTWNEKIYKRCCCFNWACCYCKRCGDGKCKCWKDYWHCFCCFKANVNDDDKKKEKRIKKKINEIESGQYLDKGDNKNNPDFFDISNKDKRRNFLIIFYVASIFHFIALSEIHGVLLALLKEIERTVKFYIREYYKKDEVLDEDGHPKTFQYFLTTSNYHDSSQINFNYVSSIFTLLLIKLFNTKYNIVILYLISIFFLLILLSLLLPIDYLTEEIIMENLNLTMHLNFDNDNEERINDKKCYSKLKFTFCFIFPYLFIYCFAGFISLLPNKILDDIYKKKKKILQLKEMICINSSLVLGVVAKNILNKLLLKSSKITYILISEILFFFFLL